MISIQIVEAHIISYHNSSSTFEESPFMKNIVEETCYSNLLHHKWIF